MLFIVVFTGAIGCADEPPPADETVETNERMASQTSAELATAPTDAFKLDLELRAGEEQFLVSVFFADEFAVEFEPGDDAHVAAVYHLDRMSWTEFSPPRTVTLQECESWAQASAERTRQSLASSQDENLNKFISLSLDPQFEVVEADDTLEIRNEILTYVISDPQSSSDEQRAWFFAYDRLNSYRKAILERKLAPYAQLAVDDELEKRDFVPGSIKLQVSTPVGIVELAMQLRIADVTPEEWERVRNAIKHSASTVE